MDAERQALRDLVVSGLVGLSTMEAETTVRAAVGYPQLPSGSSRNLDYNPKR